MVSAAQIIPPKVKVKIVKYGNFLFVQIWKNFVKLGKSIERYVLIGAIAP